VAAKGVPRPSALVSPLGPPPSEAPPRRAVAGNGQRQDAGDGRAKRNPQGGKPIPPRASTIKARGAPGGACADHGPRSALARAGGLDARSDHALCRVGFRRWLLAGGGPQRTAGAPRRCNGPRRSFLERSLPGKRRATGEGPACRRRHVARSAPLANGLVTLRPRRAPTIVRARGADVVSGGWS
jgi:hypothetical protein